MCGVQPLQGNNGGVNEDEVAQRLRSRTDPASAAAVARLDAGGTWWPGVQVVTVASERQGWSRPEEPYSDLAIIGREELLAELSATRHSTLEEATLDYRQPGLGLSDRFLVYLAPGTSDVVACVGVVPAPRPPMPVYPREEVPDTVEGAATAFRSYRRLNGQPASFEVRVQREFDSAEAEALYSAWPQRAKGWYSKARKISLLGAAEVSVVEPRGHQFDGYLLILDIPPDSEIRRHRRGRVDALLLAPNVRGDLLCRVVNCFQYQGADPARP